MYPCLPGWYEKERERERERERNEKRKSMGSKGTFRSLPLLTRVIFTPLVMLPMTQTEWNSGNERERKTDKKTDREKRIALLINCNMANGPIVNDVTNIRVPVLDSQFM